MHYQMEGLILRHLDVRDRDRFLVILTRKHGLIRAFARNIYSSRSHLCGHVDAFCYGDFHVYHSKKDTFTVDEAFSRASFFDLQKDVLHYSLATYFCDLVQAFEPQPEESEAFLRLMLNALYLLTKAKRTARFMKPVVELRMACIAGYMPDVAGCAKCGSRDMPLFFSPEHNGVYCRKCAPGDARLYELDHTLLTAMQYICYATLERLFSFQISDPAALDRLGEITEAYVLHITERTFRPLRVYHQLEKTEL